jgi:hypothetical protein
VKLGSVRDSAAKLTKLSERSENPSMHLGAHGSPDWSKIGNAEAGNETSRTGDRTEGRRTTMSNTGPDLQTAAKRKDLRTRTDWGKKRRPEARLTGANYWPVKPLKRQRSKRWLCAYEKNRWGNRTKNESQRQKNQHQEPHIESLSSDPKRAQQDKSDQQKKRSKIQFFH